MRASNRAIEQFTALIVSETKAIPFQVRITRKLRAVLHKIEKERRKKKNRIDLIDLEYTRLCYLI